MSDILAFLTFLMLSIIIFGGAFALMWLIISAIMAVIGGWTTLAGHYPGPDTFDGTCWSWQSASFGLVRHRHILTVGANRHGLYLAQFILFRFMHPPLFIPWSDVAGIEKKPLFFNGVLHLTPVIELRFAKAPSNPVYFHRELVDKLVHASAGAWRYQTVALAQKQVRKIV